MNTEPKRNWLSSLGIRAQAMLALIARDKGVGPAVQIAEQLLRASIRPGQRRRIGWSAKSDQANRQQRRERYAPAEPNFHTYPKHDARVRQLMSRGVRFAARQALKEFWV